MKTILPIVAVLGLIPTSAHAVDFAVFVQRQRVDGFTNLEGAWVTLRAPNGNTLLRGTDEWGAANFGSIGASTFSLKVAYRGQEYSVDELVVDNEVPSFYFRVVFQEGEDVSAEEWSDAVLRKFRSLAQDIEGQLPPPPTHFTTEQACELANPGWECERLVLIGQTWFYKSREIETPALDAHIAADPSAPTTRTWIAGESYDVSFAVENLGTATWTAAQEVKLGFQSPQDSGLWDPRGRILLSPSDAIGPGQIKTFNFSVHAPSTPGIYTLQVRMLQEGVTWFGNLSTATTITVAPAPKLQDFNGDGRPDFIWQNRSSGALAYWLMDGVTRVSYDSLPEGNDPALSAWRLVGTVDLYDNGKPDLLLQHKSSGSIAHWVMNGVNRVYCDSFPQGNDPILADWHLAGAVDLNGDRQPDLLWQHKTSGALAYWIMNGATRVYADSFPQGNDPLLSTWRLAGADDINGDDKPDLIFQNKTSGVLVYWIMDGVNRVYADSFPQGNDAALSNWRFAGTADLNDDGKPDLLWQNRTSGALAHWIMDHVTRVSAGGFPNGTDPALVDWALNRID